MENKIYSFFIGLALLFWNPLAYYLLYRNTPVYFVKAINVLYWMVFSLGILSICLLSKIPEKIKKILFAFAMGGIVFSILALANATQARMVEPEGLIFTPNTAVHYKTSEFDFIVRTNSLGLRNKEFELHKSKFRILCFGDSWTYGWGVNVENAWPAKLETILQSKGYAIEVINCGQAGTHPNDYARYIKKLVPILKPDLVLVGILQGDDLAQLYENDPIFSPPKPEKSLLNDLKSGARMYLQFSVNNIIKTKHKQVEVKEESKKSAKEIISKFSYLEKVRYKTLPDSVRILFEGGNLNPGLVYYYLQFPDRLTIFNNPNHPATQFAIKKMDQDLKIMKASFDKTVFVNLPLNIFTGHEVIRCPSDIYNPYFAVNNKVDSIYKDLAEKNKLDYIELTNHFLRLEKTGYFYRFDGHPTEKGYEEIASYIASEICVKLPKKSRQGY